MTEIEFQNIKKWTTDLTVIFEKYGTYDSNLKIIIIKTGIDIARSTFELIRAHKTSSILITLNKHKAFFEKSSKFEINDDIDFYFGYCKVVGENIALGTPEKIAKLLEGTARIVN